VRSEGFYVNEKSKGLSVYYKNDLIAGNHCNWVTQGYGVAN